jgi:hypothetical protein
VEYSASHVVGPEINCSIRKASQHGAATELILLCRGEGQIATQREVVEVIGERLKVIYTANGRHMTDIYRRCPEVSGTKDTSAPRTETKKARAPLETSSAATFSDPHDYCKAVGAIDAPDARYVGPSVTPQMRAVLNAKESGSVLWRCMDGAVLGCVSFNSPVCGKFKPYENMSQIETFCTEYPNQKIIGESVTGRAPVQWACRNGKPYIKSGDFRVDKRDYPVESWKVVFPQ